jgi:hypothetical protein
MDLALLEVRGPAELVTDVAFRLAGVRLVQGGIARVGDVWCCRRSARELLLICPPGEDERLRAQLGGERYRSTAFALVDRDGELAPIGLVGRAVPAVLRALGVYGPTGDPRTAAPFARVRMADVDVLWLLESDHSAIALGPADAADAVWHAIERAGRPHGLSCVGHDAAQRYGLLARA